MTDWAITVTAFVLLFICMRQSRIPWWVNAGLALIGGVGLVGTFVGDWVTSALGATAPVVNLSTAVLSGLLMLMALIVAVCTLLDKQADKMTILALAMLPVLFTVASGPLADAGSQMTSTVREAGGGGLSSLIGG